MPDRLAAREAIDRRISVAFPDDAPPLTGAPTPLRLSLLSDRRDHPALGVLGGEPGAPALIEFGDGTRPHPKSRTMIAPGTRLRMTYAGRGGYGDPQARDPDAACTTL